MTPLTRREFVQRTALAAAAGVSTNGNAQWGLAAIQCLALAGDVLPEAG